MSEPGPFLVEPGFGATGFSVAAVFGATVGWIARVAGFTVRTDSDRFAGLFGLGCWSDAESSKWLAGMNGSWISPNPSDPTGLVPVD